MVVGVGSRLEWCIVGVVVGMGVELVGGPLVELEASPGPSTPRPRRHPPPLSGAALMALVVAIVTVGGGAVQGVAAVAALLVLVEAALVALVTLLPRSLWAGSAHARGRSLEGEGQKTLGGGWW